MTGRTGAVVEAIRRRLAARMLLPGEKLPSIRAFAATMQVSPSTVVEAYDRLAAEGVIHARQGSGFFVSGPMPSAAAAAERPVPERAIDPLWVSQQSLDADAHALRPGCGWLPPDWMPLAAIRRAMRSLARDGDAILVEYGSTRGSPALRHILARQSAGEGCPVGTDQFLLTASASQSLDLVCRVLLRPGDTVLLDDPCYFNFHALLHAHGARVVGIPYTPEGPDLSLFEQALVAYRPRLYVTNAALQNPTGATLSLRTAHRLLGLAAAHGLTIVEDEILADLEPDRSPRLTALDGLSRVIRIGSFSKTLSASLRCGYIAAHSDYVGSLRDLQVATGFGGPSPISAELVVRLLTDGAYRKHLGALHLRLAKARREVGAKLSSLGIAPWLMPRGGFYLWCRLPDGADAAAVARVALREGVVLAPGNVFSPSRTASNFMRFNVAQMGEPRVFEILANSLKGTRG